MYHDCYYPNLTPATSQQAAYSGNNRVLETSSLTNILHEAILVSQLTNIHALFTQV